MPDKFCDQISDAVVDECLLRDPLASVACEFYVTMGVLIMAGEGTTRPCSTWPNWPRKSETRSARHHRLTGLTSTPMRS